MIHEPQYLESPSLPAALRRLVGSEHVIDEPAALRPYSTDWMGSDLRLPDLAVLPADNEEIAEIVRLAGAAGLPIVARGAGTGLAGGARTTSGGLVVSTTRMNAIERIDLANRRAIVQPGLLNYDLSQQLQAYGYFYAPDPASWKLCTIGGNIANNSGGPRCLKYGVTTNHVLAVEVALHDGALLWTGDGVQDAAGYDLTGLIVGSEGTFGLVTKALVRLTRAPEANRVMLALFPNIVAACEVVSAVLAAGYLPTALEVMDATTMLAVNRAQQAGLPAAAGAALIVEVDGVADGLDETMDAIIALCRRGGALDVQSAASAEAQERLWSARRSAFASFHTIAPTYYLVDTVVPRTRLPAMMAHVERLSQTYDMPIANVFHAGDGNLHPLVLYDPADPAQVAKAHAITAEVLEASIAEGGTVSGEHGIGVEKRAFLARLFSPADLQAQAALYAIFNPNDRLNPGKIFPEGMNPLELAAVRRSRIERTAGNRQPADAEHLGVELARIVGSAYCLGGSTAAAYTIQGHTPDLVALPGNLDELAAVIAACHRARAVVAPWGGGSQQEIGRLEIRGLEIAMPGAQSPIAQPQSLAVVVSTRRLRAVLRYEPADLTIGVGAGMTLAELQNLLAGQGQMLPLDAPLPEQATIGGLVATATDGPRRLGYGTLRDWVLGLTLVEVDGTVVRCGGQTVKNVSGYDLARLFTGSYGTLGIIAEVRLRVFPRPQAEATLLACFARREQALALASDLASAQLTPSAVEYLDNGALQRLGIGGGCALAVRAEGVPAACRRHMDDITRLAQQHDALDMRPFSRSDHGRLWAAIADLAAATYIAGDPLPGAGQDEALIRLAVPPADLGAALADLEALVAAHGALISVHGRALNGVIYARLHGDVVAIQGALAARWRHSHVLACNPALKTRLPVWGGPVSGAGMMQAIRSAFDPFGALNPGRLEHR